MTLLHRAPCLHSCPSSIHKVRKNCKTLILTLDGPEQNKLQSEYDTFIKEIENLDSKAGLGLRGRKDVDMQPSYDSSLKALTLFYDSAQALLESPTIESTPISTQ